jgi:hypothetical protein
MKIDFLFILGKLFDLYRTFLHIVLCKLTCYPTILISIKFCDARNNPLVQAKKDESPHPPQILHLFTIQIR